MPTSEPSGPARIGRAAVRLAVVRLRRNKRRASGSLAYRLGSSAPSWRRRSAAVTLTVGLVLGASACAKDDGAAVRDACAGGSASGASGSAAGGGSASGGGSETCPEESHGSGSEAAACKPVGDAESADITVEVTLDEWKIELDRESAPAGKIAFVNKNVGKDAHELVVVEGVAPDDLPLDDQGALDEDKLPDGALIGEVEGFPAGDDCTGVFDLAPGDYTLLCNLVHAEHAGKEVHLDKGMVTTFTVLEAGG